MVLREYQQKCSDAVIGEWRENVSTLVVIPTGGGKTICFADIIKRVQPQRVMVLAHREELIWQARSKIEAYSGIECDIEMGELQAHPGLFDKKRVVIATVQTLNAGCNGDGRRSKFDPNDFGFLICDEAHHSTSETYVKTFDWFKRNPDLRILGVTATPDRADEEALGKVFDTVAFDYEILDAVHEGWLVPIYQKMVTVGSLDYSAIRTTAGDLNGADLAAVMEAERNLQGMAAPSIEIIGRRRAIMFTASVKHAEMMCAIFNRHREGMAAWICGKTDKEERRRILEQFKEGKIQVVVNCGVLTEGFDDAGVEVIIMGRPTKSRSLYAQMVGRSTRPLEGLVDPLPTPEERKAAIAASTKPNSEVVDFVGNSGRHKLVTAADILGGRNSDEAIERAKLNCAKNGQSVSVSVAIDEAEEELKKEAEARRLAEEARKRKLVARVQWTARTVNPFEVLDLTPQRERGWDHGRTLSEKQRALLLKQGIDPSSLPYNQAKQILNDLFSRWDNGLCSFGQAKWLKRNGYDTHMPRDAAHKLMDAWKANGWKRPVEMEAA